MFALQQQLGGKYLQPPHELLTLQSRLQSENHENHVQAAAELNKQLILQHLELNSLKNYRLTNVKTQYATIYFDKHGSADDTDTPDD